MFPALATALALTAHAADSDKEKQQNQILSMEQDTLQRLYKAEPKTKAAIKNAHGYAVFNWLGLETAKASP